MATKTDTFQTKPAIYPCDPYQTHDFLMVDSGKVDGNIRSVFSSLGEHFPSLGSVWIIGRYSVYDYEWCDQWTIKIYPFLKEISRTWLVENTEYNGVNYGFKRKHPSFPSIKLDTFPTSVKLKITKGKTVCVTWLEKHQGESINGLDNSVSIWEKQYQTFTAFKDDLSINLDTTRWLLNSCVVSEGGQIVDSTGLVLYSGLDSTLGNIKSKLNIPRIEVLTAVDFDYKVNYYASIAIGPSGGSWGHAVKYMLAPSVADSPFIYWSHNATCTASVSPYKNPLFQVVPDSYCFAWIQLANNNFENNSVSTSLPDSVLDILCYEDSISLNSSYYDRPFQKYYQEHGYFSTYRERNLKFPVGDINFITIGSITNNNPREGAGWSFDSVIGIPTLRHLRFFSIDNTFSDTDIPLFDKRWIAQWPFWLVSTKENNLYEKIGTGWVHPNIFNDSGQPYQLTDSTRYCWYKHSSLDGYSRFKYINDEQTYNPFTLTHGSDVVLSKNREINECTNSEYINHIEFQLPLDNELFESQRTIYAHQCVLYHGEGTLQSLGPYYEGYEWLGFHAYTATASARYSLITTIKYQEVDTTKLENAPVISEIDVYSKNVVLSQSPTLSLNDYDYIAYMEGGQVGQPPWTSYVDTKQGTDTYLLTLKRNLRLFPRQPKILKEVKGTNNQTNYQEVSVSHVKEVIDNAPDDQDGITESVFYCFTKEAKSFVIESGKYYVLSKTSNGIIPSISLPSSGKVIVGFLGNIDFQITLFGNIFSALESNNKAFLFYRKNGYWNSHEVNTTMSDSPTTMAIAAALGVSQYSKNPVTPGQERRWNLGAMIHAIAVSQGLNFDANCKIMAPDNSVEYDDGQSVYNRYGVNQAGIAWNDKDAKGKDYGESVPFVGYLYDVITPKVKANEFTGELSDMDTGGMVGCPNLPAILEAFKRDVMKTLGGDESVTVVPSADGLGYGVYEGLASMITEGLYMQSYGSAVDMKTFINSQKCFGMLQEVLRGQGLAIEPKEFFMTVNNVPVKGIYPGLSGTSPSQADFALLILAQLAHILPLAMSAPMPVREETNKP